MSDWHLLLRPPYIFLVVAVISFSAAVVSTYTGKTCGRFSGCVYRAEKPVQFWLAVAMYHLGGVLFIGLFLYKVYGL
jgi:hypothetical protein